MEIQATREKTGYGKGAGRDDNEALIGIGACLGFVAVLISCIMCCVAVHTCEKEAFCINKNGNSLQIENKLYSGGRYWIGAGHEMINFSRRQYTLVMMDDYKTSSTEADGGFYNRKDWNVNGRSKDGLKIELGYALHFTVGTTHEEGDKEILYEELVSIYNNFGQKGGWRALVQRIALGAIKDITTKYVAFDFFRIRNQIQAEIEVRVREHLEEFGFTLKKGLMISVSVNRGFDEAIKETEVVRQRQTEYVFLKLNEEVLGKTEVAVADVQAEVAISGATAIADSIQLVKEAEAESLEDSIKKESDAMKYVQSKLKSKGDEDHLMSFVWLRLLEAKIDDGVKTHVIINNPLYDQ